jgi:hypothetical protein
MLWWLPDEVARGRTEPAAVSGIPEAFPLGADCADIPAPLSPSRRTHGSTPLFLQAAESVEVQPSFPVISTEKPSRMSWGMGG